LLPYSSAKTAATGFSHGLRSELSGTGVKVTTVAPGLIRTGSYHAAVFKGNQAAEAKWFSLAASAPGLSMDANRAARQIVSAVKRGDADAVLSVPAEFLAKLNGLAPGFTQDLLGRLGKMVLPDAVENGHKKPGWSLPNLHSPKMRALLLLGRRAANRLNQKMA
jgi:short-subunit dehydrogenase